MRLGIALIYFDKVTKARDTSQENLNLVSMRYV